MFTPRFAAARSTRTCMPPKPSRSLRRTASSR
ncbi:hypothetical protein E2C01_099870 [Portunus trituberculatus]|uniref:Uncharacterized protein n=1 Tax=Portunus trituberculatus TaxID=210409 RepID=A0A5B7KBH5_PORTR|nr:hypothetical protein [Portunus trituberculatus]